MLIGTFVNAIYLYDDKAVIALNYKDGTKTVNFNDMECALSRRASIPGSDLEILSPPYTFLAQMAEQRIFNPKVAGSSPAERTTRTDGGMEDAPG